MEELDYATCEAKLSDESRTGVGGSRVVFIPSRDRIRNDHWAGCRYADGAEHLAAPP